MRARVRETVRQRCASTRLAAERPPAVLALAACALGLADAVGPMAARFTFAPIRLSLSVILRWPRSCAALGCMAKAGALRGSLCSRLRVTGRARCRWLLSVGNRSGEIQSGRGRNPLAQLLAQMPGAHLLDRALRQLAELERTERHPDQPVHREPKVAEHVLDLAVLALAHREGQPHIGPLLAVEPRLDRAVADAVDFDAVLEPVESQLGDLAVGAYAVAPGPAGC